MEEKHLKAWAEWLKAKELSNNSKRMYMFYFTKFEMDKLSYDYVVEFVNKYKNQVARSFLNNLLLWIRTTDIEQNIKDKTKDIQIPKVTGRKKRILPKILTWQEVIKISEAMQSERNSLMVLLLYAGALRVSELVNIRLYDFRWDEWHENQELQGKLKVTGKGNKQRMVFIPPKIMERVNRYKEDIEDFNKGNKDFDRKECYLFFSDDYYNHIGTARVEKLIRIASSKAIGYMIKTHTFRHSMATQLLNIGWDLLEIQKYLGHESLSTVQIYTHLSDKRLAEKYAKGFRAYAIFLSYLLFVSKPPNVLL